MATSYQSEVRSVIEEVMRSRSVPGIVIAVARGDDDPDHIVAGTDAAGRPLTPDTLIPVASITKLATALAVLRLAASGRVSLDDPLARHLPEAASAREGVNLRTLLCHVAGLPYDLPEEAAPYRPGLDWPALRSACLATPVAMAPLSQVSYSNVGPGLLAIVVERAVGKSFPEALSDLVLSPLGIEAYLGDEPPRAPARVAGLRGEHAGTDLEPFNSHFWHSLALPWGGLVTTAAGALALVRAFAGMPAGFVPPALLTEATRDQTGGLPGGLWEPLLWPRCPWGLGVELRGEKSPHWTPSIASPSSFGHAGSSGCLAWYDPATETAWAILGPRVFGDWWEDWSTIGAAILAESPGRAAESNRAPEDG